MNDQIRQLAQIVADEQIDAVEYLSVVETADWEDMHLSESEMQQAYRLARRAKAVIPDV